MDDLEKDWKLKLRYGKLKTPFKHYIVIAKGIVGELEDGFSCPPGNAFMGMKIWASSEDESAEIVQSIGNQIGFSVTGNIEIFTSEPAQPPAENPFGYDINFTPFQENE
jgi:hypothetical protein